MATKEFIIKVEEGSTNCINCPFENGSLLTIRCIKPEKLDFLNCSVVDLTTIRIKELEETKQ